MENVHLFREDGLYKKCKMRWDYQKNVQVICKEKGM